jgi:hypothetical protein
MIGGISFCHQNGTFSHIPFAFGIQLSLESLQDSANAVNQESGVEAMGH